MLINMVTKEGDVLEASLFITIQFIDVVIVLAVLNAF